jgi:ribosomal protein L25 (general stress protein Ctc)
MKEINLEVVNREKIGKSNSKNLRNDGKVPAIIYGDKKESNYIFLECLDIMK